MFSKTFKTTLAATLLISGSAFATSSTLAQDELVVKKMEDVTILEMTMIKFKPNKGKRAYDMMKDHFRPAAEKAGTSMPWVMHLDSGKWDAVHFWDLEGGYADLDWEMSPDGVKFVKALRKLEGGKDKADALFKEWRSLISARDRIFGHHHLTDKEKADKKKD